VYTGRRSINLAEVAGGGGGGGVASSSSSPGITAKEGAGCVEAGPPPALIIGPDGGACVGVRLPSFSCDLKNPMAADGEGGGVDGDVEAPPPPPQVPAGGVAGLAPPALPGEEEEVAAEEEARARGAC
jgi:hypothetical protein